MDYVSIIGMVGATLTTISQVPQLIKILKTRHTKDLSINTYLVLLTGVILWIIYGLLLKEPPIYVANIVTGFLAAAILFYKLKYG